MTNLLSGREFRVLEGLRFAPRKSFSGKIRGERLTRKKGTSIEFSDYRDYTEGDDLRHLDWNVLARLESPIMKTYRDEEDLAVHLLVDRSPSMNFGEPLKSETAAKLATAFGYIALCGGDALYPRMMGTKSTPTQVFRGRSSFARLNRYLSAPDEEPSTTFSLAASIRAFANQSARAGLVVLITDGMDPDLPAAIRVVGGRGHELFLLQVLSDVEIDPDIEGDLRLLDAETNSRVEITANSAALRYYREALNRHNESLREACLRICGRYILINSSDTVESTVHEKFKREGWVK